MANEMFWTNPISMLETILLWSVDMGEAKLLLEEKKMEHPTS